LPGAATIDFVIDINPHKQRRYAPGTSQQVVSPDRLTDICPEVIIVMNPLYLEEISKMINTLKLPAGKKVRQMSAGRRER